MNIRYFLWDRSADTVIEYAREGECNECGACCMTQIRFKAYAHGLGKDNPIAGWDSRNGEFFVYADAVKVIEVQVNGKSRYFHDIEITDIQERCSMLTDDNRCMRHIGKHLLSRAWPMSPDQIAAFPECSYRFVEIGRWRISELNNQEMVTHD